MGDNGLHDIRATHREIDRDGRPAAAGPLLAVNRELGAKPRRATPVTASSARRTGRWVRTRRTLAGYEWAGAGMLIMAAGR
jgi:hypothetical protein